MADTPISRLLQWQKGVPRGPHRLTIFPTNICNIECKHCWQRWADYDKTYKSEVTDERLLALVVEAHELGVKEWYFVGGGDAMGRGKLVIAMCEKIRALGMNGYIHTNGTLFKKGMFDRLIDIAWGNIYVSLDGPTAEINDHIRSRGFAKATAALKELSELKKARGSQFPRAGIYSTITNLTYDKIDQFAELAHELGLDDGSHISGLIVEGEESAQFELSPAQKKALPEFLEKAIKRAEELGVKNNFRAYQDESLTDDGMNMHQEYEYRPDPTAGIAGAMCYEPWHSISLLPDGRMGPCCAWYDEEAISIKDMSLKDVWLGAYMNKVREGMVSGCPPDYCKRCPSNLFVAKENNRREFSRILRERNEWDGMSPGSRAARIAVKGLHNVREHGLRKALIRGLEWRKLQDGT